MQAVQNLKNALTQRGATDYRVVNDDEVVFIGTQRTVTDVIDVSCQVVALAVVSNKGSHLDVLPYHLLGTHIVALLAETIRHTVIGHLGRVRDIREYGIGDVAIDSFQNSWGELHAQSFALLIDVAV